jgi:hypothetical protein
MRTWQIPTLAALLVVAGCDEMQTVDAIECPAARGPFTLDTSRITGTVTFDPPAAPLTRGDTLVIDGSAHHEDGLAIHDVRVGSTSVEKLGFNYATWRGTLTWEQIIGVATIDAQGDGSITVSALDACGNLYPFATFEVPIDPNPNIRIDSLAISVAYPGETTSLPANGRTQAIVTVSAEGRAVGARVVVKTSAGSFQGLGSEGEVVLTAPFGDATTARAELLYTTTEPGAALLTAEVKNILASGVLRAVGMPVFAPASGVLQPGNSLVLTVRAEGGLAQCFARADSGWFAVIDETPLDLQGLDVAEMAADDGTRVAITIAADALAEPGAAVVLSCEDVHGQTGGARFEIGEAP